MNRRMVCVLICCGMLLFLYGCTANTAKDNTMQTPPPASPAVPMVTATAALTATPATSSGQVVYENTDYGFTVTLPRSWQGYTVVDDAWHGVSSTPGKDDESGPLISIRNPLRTEQKPYQDIPIMVFSIDQWNAMNQDAFHIGAAPVNPTELARSDTYVYALPARYNFAYPAGYEEVDQLIQQHVV